MSPLLSHPSPFIPPHVLAAPCIGIIEKMSTRSSSSAPWVCSVGDEVVTAEAGTWVIKPGQWHTCGMLPTRRAARSSSLTSDRLSRQHGFRRLY